MALIDELQEARYKGALFFMDSSSIAGGRKDNLKEIVNSDLQVVEDLGLRQPSFSLSGVVSARLVPSVSAERQTYKQMRDTLLDALQEGGTGTLVHPFYGPIEDVVCRSWSIKESIGNVGIANFTMEFTISNTLGTPRALVAVLGSVVTVAEATAEELAAALADDWKVTEGFAGNFIDAFNNTEDFVNKVLESAGIVTKVASEVDQFSKFMSDFAADIARLIDSPRELSESIRGSFSSLNGLLQTAPATFDAMKNLFDFGDNNIELVATTAGQIERQKNRDRMNSQVQGEALARAYVVAGELELPTVEDIDELQGILEDQFQKISAAEEMDRNSFDALTETRIILSEFFNSQRATAPRQVTVFVNPVPARVLAFNYYGSSEQGEDIANLNKVRDAAFLEGDIEILSS